jgi:hypothetical protein
MRKFREMTVARYADDNDDLTTLFYPVTNGYAVSISFLFLVVRVVRVVRNAHEIDICWLTTPMTMMTTRDMNRVGNSGMLVKRITPRRRKG